MKSKSGREFNSTLVKIQVNRITELLGSSIDMLRSARQMTERAIVVLEKDVVETAKNKLTDLVADITAALMIPYE